jgi:hypothetical protein
MTVSVFYNKQKYELPDSMRSLNEYQDDSMKERFYGGWHLKLSHLKIVDILTDEDEDEDLSYKIFVGVMPTTGNTRIIIYGEYFENRPYEYGSFNYIEVDESKFIKFDDQSSKFILDVGNNSCAILLNSELILIGITPEFQDFLHEEAIDLNKYDDDYLSSIERIFIKRIDFIRDITDLSFYYDDSDSSFELSDEHMTSRVEKVCDGCKIELYFTCVCHYSKKIHSETTNNITIYISNEQIRISHDMKTTTYERYIVGATGYNDRPTKQTDERNATFHHVTIINLISEEDY